MKVICLLAITLLIAACASASRVTTTSGTSPGAEFAGYRTYAWRGKPPLNTPLEQRRLVVDIDAQLQAKGWTESAEADVAVTVDVTTSQKQTTETYYSQGRTQGWGLRPDSSGLVESVTPPTVTVHINKIGTLTVKVIDTKTEKIVWHGEAEITIPSSPERLDAAIDSAVGKMFSRFPAVVRPSLADPP